MTPGRSAAPVAIVGMACVFPGARNLGEYWANILGKVSAIGDPPADWEADLFVDPGVEANDRIYCARGGYLGSLAEFDPPAHGVMPNAVDGGEPDHFLALRAAHEALDDAGCLAGGFDRTRAAVIVGRGSYVNRGNTTAIQHGIVIDQVLRVLRQLHPEHTDEALAALKRELKASLPPFHAETAPALVPNVITGRIANRLDLMGPNYIVDAACASSLVAVDLGMRDLRSGRCDLAVVGGVHASTPPVILMIFCQLRAIARGGTIRPFDRRAEGTLLGEGVGMVVLKRLADAQRAGDRIYAVIREVGTASDGRAVGLLAPRVEGEELALRRAYDAAGLDPATVGLIEAHGTGTAVGDAVEVEALARVFGASGDGRPRTAVGTVKSMIGHLMPASGIAGLIKTALALHHKVLPATINCEEPDPRLPLARGGLYINSETRPWIHGHPGHPRRAGVNAFGFGGINAHAVLEEHPGGDGTADLAERWESELVLLSAATRAALLAEVGRLGEYLEAAPDTVLADLAFTLNVAAPLRPLRLAVVARDVPDLAAKLARAASALGDPQKTRIRDRSGLYFDERPLAEAGGVAFVFPGEGSQYRGMLADLCLAFPVVREAFDLMDRAFIGHRRAYLPSEVIFPPPADATLDRLWEMDAGAEAVFAANQAMLALLGQLEIRPRFMTGHSTGEHSALLAAGIVRAADEDELIRHILGVNRSFEQLRSAGDVPGGVLTAVGGVDRARLAALVDRSGGDLHIALDNCPHQVVLCGTDIATASARRELEAEGAICQPLPFQRAYHTPWFATFCEPLRAYFGGVAIGSAEAAVYSCVTAEPFPDDPDQVRALVATQWAKTVRFRDTVEAMHRDGARIFIEVGPRANLTSFIEDTLRGRSCLAVASNTGLRPGITDLHHLLGQLAVHGVAMNLAPLYVRRSPNRVALDLAEAPAAPARPAHVVRIKTGLQPFRLSPGFALPGEESRPAPASPPSPAPRVDPAAGDVRPPGARRAIADHLQTMDRFLRVQRDMMERYLARRGAEPVGRTPSRPAGPLAIAIEEAAPGRRVAATWRIAASEDRWIRDHTLGRDVSADDPELMALPVVPLTMSMEALAETAAILAPERVLVGMRALRARRWITLEEADRTLHVTAVVVERPPGVDRADGAHPGDAPPCAVHAVIAAAGEPRQPLVEATLLFADGYAAAPQARPFALDEERASRWTPDRLYRDGMFHGPCFRAVRSVDRMGRDGASATLDVLPRRALFTGTSAPAFLLDPVLVDAAGQVLAFWAKERLEPGVDVFPYRVESVRLYGPPPEAGHRMTCTVRAEPLGDDGTRCDFTVAAADGRPYCEVEGWEDRRFRLPRALVDLQREPRRVFLSRPVPDAGGRGRGDAAARRVDAVPEALLLAHGGIWLEVVAHAVLGRRERVRWRGLASSPPAARCRWLLERVAAKDAVRQLAAERHGVELYPADVEIHEGEAGCLEAVGPALAALGLRSDVAAAGAHV